MLGLDYFISRSKATKAPRALTGVANSATCNLQPAHALSLSSAATTKRRIRVRHGTYYWHIPMPPVQRSLRPPTNLVAAAAQSYTLTTEGGKACQQCLVI